MANQIPVSIEQHATTAEIVRQIDQPKADSDRDALFEVAETERFRTHWHDIQASFVDEPKKAVENADELVASMIKRLAEIFATEKEKLEHDWVNGQDSSTEDLRLALRRYRSFFDRLLSV